YSVFGEVVEGRDVVDKIAKVPLGGQTGDTPTQAVWVDKGTVRAPCPARSEPAGRVEQDGARAVAGRLDPHGGAEAAGGHGDAGAGQGLGHGLDQRGGRLARGPGPVGGGGGRAGG